MKCVRYFSWVIARRDLPSFRFFGRFTAHEDSTVPSYRFCTLDGLEELPPNRYFPASHGLDLALAEREPAQEDRNDCLSVRSGQPFCAERGGRREEMLGPAIRLRQLALDCVDGSVHASEVCLKLCQFLGMRLSEPSCKSICDSRRTSLTSLKAARNLWLSSSRRLSISARSLRLLPVRAPSAFLPPEDGPPAPAAASTSPNSSSVSSAVRVPASSKLADSSREILSARLRGAFAAADEEEVLEKRGDTAPLPLPGANEGDTGGVRSSYDSSTVGVSSAMSR